MNNIDKMNEARLQKCLNKKYRFSCGVMTLGEYFEKNPPAYKTLYIQTKTTKRIHLEYKELKNPKKIYTLWQENGNGNDVPKIVFDYFDVEDRSKK